MQLLLVILLTILFIIIFLVGVFVGVYKTFPYNLLDSITSDKKLNNKTNDIEPPKFDFYSIIHIENQFDIYDKQKKLINFIWKDENLPTGIPSLIDSNITDKRFDDLNDLKQIDKFTFEMDHGINSIAYLFTPNLSNQKLIIYHQGHSGGFILGKSTINYFLDQGYSILAFSMPLTGMNNSPTIHLDPFGPIIFQEHKQFALLDTQNFSSLNYFFTPITLSLNYVDQNFNFESYNMIGLSGGGWVSTIYPTLDTRISQSFAVASSLPMSLRNIPDDIGDYEQITPELYEIANYPEFYVMSSFGTERKFVQIFNEYDPCCFAGTTYKSYEDDIKQKINELGTGKFDILLDSTHKKHEISEFALNNIQKLLLQ
jgi:hypothetical protein